MSSASESDKRVQAAKAESKKYVIVKIAKIAKKADMKRKSNSQPPRRDGTLPSSKSQAIPSFPLHHSSPVCSPLGDKLLHPGPYNSPPAASEWGNCSDSQFQAHEYTGPAGVSTQTVTFNCCDAHAQGIPEHVSLPDQETAEWLVNLASQQSSCLVEIIDESTVRELLRACYSGPPPKEHRTLCLIYMLFAIGSVVARTKNLEFPDFRGSPATAQADSYFGFAHSNLCTSGFEHAELWKVQAWALMTTYYLASSQWGAADTFIGLAVKATYKIGITRSHEPSSRAPGGALLKEDYNRLAKGIFVLDSLVAALSGRQTQSNKEGNCLPHTPSDYSPAALTHGEECLEFNVASAKMIRDALELVYQRRQVADNEVFTLLMKTQECSPPSPACDGREYAANDLASLEARLFRSYVKMLLMRPFFLQDMASSSKQRCFERSDTCKYLSEKCVETALKAIGDIRHMLDENQRFYENYLWRPCLFTGVLIVLSNQYFGLYQQPNAEAAILQAFQILDRYVARCPAEENELKSLLSLNRLVENRKQRSQSFNAYVNLDRYHINGATVKREESSPILTPHDFAVVCGDPAAYCNPDVRRFSFQSSLGTSDNMEPELSPSTAQISTWNLPSMAPSFHLPRCGSDASYYGFAVQQDGYEGDCIEVPPEFVPYPERQLYRP
ncbi:hypothetical protein PWT90_07340 [Aphanocladium album]|nr:hypothetical protein PWT90_07340 [Aphanocladium album]